MSNASISRYSTTPDAVPSAAPGVSPALVRILCGAAAPFAFVIAGMCFYFLVQPFGTNPPPKEVALGVGIVFSCIGLGFVGVALFYRGRPTENPVVVSRLSGVMRVPSQRPLGDFQPDVRPAPVVQPYAEAGPRRPLLTDLMGATAIIAGIAGPVLGYITYQRQAVLNMGQPEPRLWNVADLGKNGPGDNIHVRFTGFEFGTNYALTLRKGSWSAVCLPAFPKGKTRDPHALRVLVRTSRVRNEEELRGFCKRSEIQGVVINSLYEWENDKSYMKDAYPGCDTSRMWVVQESYTFPTQSEIQTMYGISSGCVGLAVFCGFGAMMRRRG